MLTAFCWWAGTSDTLAQVPTCDPSVPFLQVNLSGYPAGTWISPSHSRHGNCCGTSSPDRCTSFEVILDTGAAMINLEIYSGAIPPGSMFYQISCGPQVPVGQPICITGPGPHRITFCKPGNNENQYKITSIPKPHFPKDDSVRVGCSQPFTVLGLEEASITWQSVYPGTPGQYDGYLNCTSGCDTVIYTPPPGAPTHVAFKICGYPIADECGFVGTCDTVHIYNFGALTGSVAPVPAYFCSGGPGVWLSADGSGGVGPYTYTWRNQSGSIIGTIDSALATSAGSYQVEIRDLLYNAQYCPALFLGVPVTVGLPPVVNAGADQHLCYESPVAYLGGTVQNATGGYWTGGGGTFSPDSSFLDASYTPTATEISNGFANLVLHSRGAGGGCFNSTDTMQIQISSPIHIALSSVNVNCANSTATLTPVVSGGYGDYSYLWNTGSTNTSITAGQGNHCLGITDSMGCIADTCVNIIAPTPLTISMSSTDATTIGGSDGTATANPGGGTPGYSYAWSTTPVQTTQTATGLTPGLYTVTVTDANGCSITGMVAVNNPGCGGFTASTLAQHVTCFGSNDGMAVVSATGGSMQPYIYIWTDPLMQMNDTAFNLSAGIYQVLVNDTAYKCMDVALVTITEPLPLVNVMNSVNVSTIGGNDGSATANITGGTPLYNYLWQDSTGATTGTSASVNNLTAGMYYLTVTDGHGCIITDSVRITQPPCENLVIAFSSMPVSCHGGNTGSAQVVVLHGTPPYTYSWSNGPTVSSISGLTAGNYVVTVTDSRNCTNFRNISITQPSDLVVGAAPTTPTCSDSYNGSIEISVSGGSFPYYYQWSSGQTSEDLFGINNGNFSLQVTDAKGCRDSIQTFIVAPAPVLATAQVTDVTCFNGQDGVINILPSGGVGPYTFLWSNSSTTEDQDSLGTGNYSVNVYDINGCHNALSFEFYVDQPDEIEVTQTTVACTVPGTGVANVVVTPTGGSGGTYQVSFSNGSSYGSPGDYSELLPVDSTYLIIVRDSNLCVSYITDTVSIRPEVQIVSAVHGSCFWPGTSVAPVTVSGTGGVGTPYEVSFNGGTSFNTPGDYTDSLSVNASYAIVISDSLGCLSLPYPVYLPPVIQLSGTATDYNGYGISCNGLSDGAIAITVSGGTIPYHFTWSNSATTEDLTGIPAGTYTLVFNDSNLCADTLSFVITEPALLTGTLAATTNYNGSPISCYGLSDAAVNLTVSGGNSPYTYNWTNGAQTEDLSNIAAGSYTVTITDENNCTRSQTITISQPADLVVNATPVNILCNGNATGSIDATISGGINTTYAYDWSNGEITQDIDSLYAGTYTLLVTDQNSCQDSITLMLTEPAALDITDSIQAVRCNGEVNGGVYLDVAGGVAPYSYNWSNGALVQDNTGLPAGSYTLIFHDANFCYDTLTYTVTEPPVLTTNAAVTTDFNGYGVSCFGADDASVDGTVGGGTAPYAYLWNSGANTEDLSNIGAGSYTLVVTDQNGCVDSIAITVTQPSDLVVSGVVTDVLCNGFADGSIDLTASGSVPSYSYNWSNGASTEDISSLPPGTFSVTVTDANGCTETYSGQVSELAPVIISASLTPIPCFGGNDAAIDVTISGGTGNYQYAWSNGANSQDITMLYAGSYSLAVTDENGCTAADTFVVTEPAILNLALSSPIQFSGYNISYNGGSDGSITCNLSGGTLPYSYAWSTGDTTAALNQLPAGTYILTVTDANGCSVSDTITLNQPDGLAMPNGYTPNGDGSNDFFVVKGISSYPNNHFTVLNRWGNLVYEKENYQNEWNGQNNSDQALPDGTYFVVLEIYNTDIVLKSYVDLRR